MAAIHKQRLVYKDNLMSIQKLKQDAHYFWNCTKESSFASLTAKQPAFDSLRNFGYFPITIPRWLSCEGQEEVTWEITSWGIVCWGEVIWGGWREVTCQLSVSLVGKSDWLRRNDPRNCWLLVSLQRSVLRLLRSDLWNCRLTDCWPRRSDMVWKLQWMIKRTVRSDLGSK